MRRLTAQQSARTLLFLVGGVVLIALVDCKGGGTARKESRSQAATAEGVPAPPAGLSDMSSPSVFFAYGNSLQFTDSAPSAAVLTRDVGGVTSVLTVRSERRLPYTDDSAYTRGRIIARFETTGAPSVYGVPVGEAYLWVTKTGAQYSGTLIWHAASPPSDSGKMKVEHEYHEASGFGLGSPLCLALDSSSTTPSADSTKNLVCCICGTGRVNCPVPVNITMAQFIQVLRAHGM